MGRGFTLIEIIIVIIIVGILAAVGVSQYSKTVETSRGAEARQNLGQMRQLAYQYYLENGTVTGITYANVNVGTASNQLPSYGNCRDTYYFAYRTGVDAYGWWGQADRCTSGGKTPQGAAGYIALRDSFGGPYTTPPYVWSSPAGY
ncbi:MAG: prepilin-type N-terminal cleavage/methylation domain-containing protein [Candidatus Omnitrophota bacterium]